MKPPYALLGLAAAVAVAILAGHTLLSGAAFVPRAQAPSAATLGTAGAPPAGAPGSASPPSMPAPITDQPVGDISSPGAASSALFSVAVRTRQVGMVPAAPELVSAINVASHALVVPPVPARSEDWRNTSVWVDASAFPAAPSSGTSYVYGHACTAKLCPFTALRRTPAGGYTVQAGDQILVSTSTAALSYRVCGVGSSPKSGDLVVPPCNGQRVDLVIVTCEYEDGVSRDNLVVASTLVAASR